VGTAVSDAATLTVNPVFCVISHPEEVIVDPGVEASFSVEAENGTGPYTYQWQLSTDDGESWATSRMQPHPPTPLRAQRMRCATICTAVLLPTARRVKLRPMRQSFALSVRKVQTGVSCHIRSYSMTDDSVLVQGATDSYANAVTFDPDTLEYTLTSITDQTSNYTRLRIAAVSADDDGTTAIFSSQIVSNVSVEYSGSGTPAQLHSAAGQKTCLLLL
jgi:hypothetical protein